MTCQHEWVAFTTALDDGYIVVQCVRCQEIGAVTDPTKEEWAKAFYAPQHAYRWHDDSRVRLHKPGPSYVSKPPRIHLVDPEDPGLQPADPAPKI